jgi:hypothetical protein
MSRILVVSLLAWMGTLAIDRARAEELVLAAARLLETSASEDVLPSAEGAAIELTRIVLVEDDGPAAGYSYQPNEERLAREVWVKKELVIADSRADAAWLLLAPGGDLTAIINGRECPLVDPAPVGKYWQCYRVPAEALRAGANEIVLHGTGRLWIARDDEYASGSRERTRHPNRSAKSRDGGRTWSYDKLGTDDDIDGEYYVRLSLAQHRPAGGLTLPVLDAGNLSNEPIGPALKQLGSVRVQAVTAPETAGRIGVHVRSGPAVSTEAEGWSDWQILEATGEFVPVGRYIQIKLELATSNPRQSPALRELIVSSQPETAGDWQRQLRVIRSENGRLVRSAIPFEYEPLNHPRLKTLREQYQLDAVVQGAKTELELIERLAVWSAGRWQKGHLQETYPPWDGLDILAPHRDGQPVGGFCQQYNVVFLQACESFGLCGRAVSLGAGDHGLAIRSGHEVVEIWSNEFRKWIYVDGHAAWYFIDRATRVPLSLRELRARQLATIAGEPAEPVEQAKLADSQYEWQGLADWPPFAELRLIPRSNFLAEKSPLPLNQGMRGWFWTGHYAWSDETSPASPLYSRRVTQAPNWDWTLNQTQIVLEATAAPGELRVLLDTVTPSFECFEVNLNGAGWKRSPAEFTWKLDRGDNRLKARSTNIAGRAGSASLIELRYQPEL